jgi:hypothetical protein
MQYDAKTHAHNMRQHIHVHMRAYAHPLLLHATLNCLLPTAKLRLPTAQLAAQLPALNSNVNAKIKMFNARCPIIIIITSCVYIMAKGAT